MKEETELLFDLLKKDYLGTGSPRLQKENA